MKHHCKYPNKSNMEGYCIKIVKEYKNIDKYSGLLEDEIENFVWFILIKINSIIEHPKNNLEQATNYLLKIDKLTKEEYMAIPDKAVEPESAFNTVFLARHDTKEVIELISNNMRLELKKENQQLYEKFLRDVTIKCAKEIGAMNHLKISVPKKVTFGEEFIEKAKIAKFGVHQQTNTTIETASRQKTQILHGFEGLKRKREVLAQRAERAKENVQPLRKKGGYPL